MGTGSMSHVKVCVCVCVALQRFLGNHGTYRLQIFSVGILTNSPGGKKKFDR